MTVISALVLQMALTSALLSSQEVQYFPGSYFDDSGKRRLQKGVMERWPGPAGLCQLWDKGGLNEEQRVILLLGGAVYHDPMLLRVYREAVLSDSERLRQAAAYGYRDLLADQLPNVSRGVSDLGADQLAGEIRALWYTTRRHTLVEVWLQAALATEDKQLPGYRGVSLNRSSMACFRAIERLMELEDLEYLVRAYQVSDDLGNRISLLKLIEALSMNRLIIKPVGVRKGWGDETYLNALTALDRWIGRLQARRCHLVYQRIVSENLAKLGAVGVRPTQPEACHVWGLVLDQGDSRWWAVAGKRLYQCGGPWEELSTLMPDTAENRRRRDRLLNWFGFRDNPRNRTSKSDAQGEADR
jgi:hypothetical protein